MSSRIFKYRLYPSSGQISRLNQAIEDSRVIYNELLSTKRKMWEDSKKSLSRFDAQGMVTMIKKQHSMKSASQILRFAKDRLFDAYDLFFKKYNKFPRFKKPGRCTSVGLYRGQYTLYGSHVIIPKVGKIHIVKHRGWAGTPKQIVIKKSSTGKWFLCVFCDGSFSYQLPKTGYEVGVDLGLTTFAVMSDGTTIPRERFFKQEEDQLSKESGKLDTIDVSSKDHAKQRHVVALIYERMSNRRDNFCHQHSHRMVQDYDGIVFERLEPSKMSVKAPCKGVRKSITDAAWSKFTRFTTYKALSAGKKVAFVDPAYTSRTCSGCGYVQKLKLEERIYSCPHCGISLGRDLNAAKNIYRSGAALL